MLGSVINFFTSNKTCFEARGYIQRLVAGTVRNICDVVDTDFERTDEF